MTIASPLPIPPNPYAILAKVVVAVVILGLLGFLVWKAFFSGQQAAQKSATVQAKDQQIVQKAAQQSGAAAVPVIVRNYNTSATIDAQTQEAIREALKSPGAAQIVDPALDALARRAICLRSSAAGLPECQSLLNARP